MHKYSFYEAATPVQAEDIDLKVGGKNVPQGWRLRMTCGTLEIVTRVFDLSYH
jgi:hypothetical protein